jgi:hypothetical protein
MAVTGRLKKPHLFITMTCNPNWPEIRQELLPGQEPMNRPDLVSRVFKLKKQQMLDEIFKDQIFGKCPARVWTIEYQKRGLPHLHLLVFLEDSEHFLEPEVIDEMVCAELPDASSRRRTGRHRPVVVDPWSLRRPQSQGCLHGRWRVLEEVSPGLLR